MGAGNESIGLLIVHIRQQLETAFAELDAWFDQSAPLRAFVPTRGGWTVDQILEHTALTNHYLLILIEKGAQKALNNTSGLDLAQELAAHSFQYGKLDEVGLFGSFGWMRPEHMEPRGNKSGQEVREQLKQQLRQCLDVLDRLPNGEGVLYRTTMTVNNLGKIDVYEYVYFLAKHAQRHLAQMQRNAAEYAQATTEAD
ncbi:DinB family protein [Hymenobacter busanensis]|uniref:DinB family protein n=1 Tax=Hymenobacter busanensis TaxID=2607656 RepID=A0A7L4ZXE8_9BACT|nr:DinB family protein [Hymenobacter busanensis]KAA9339347.1 DinB family protein [Hymenobacter busanensis]QHJ06892.1 DinB family protein [Hymenobacter busanensis]